jgi:hypothetical protein
MPSNPRIAGAIGGSRNTPAQKAGRKRNGFQKAGLTDLDRCWLFAKNIEKRNVKVSHDTEVLASDFLKAAHDGALKDAFAQFGPSILAELSTYEFENGSLHLAFGNQP